MNRTQRRPSVTRVSGPMLPAISSNPLHPVAWPQPMFELAMPAGDLERSFSQLTSFTVGAIATTQTQTGALLELMGLSTQRKVPLFRSAVAAARSGNWFESQTRWMGFWLSALQLFQSNTAAALEIQSQAWNSWLRLFTRFASRKR